MAKRKRKYLNNRDLLVQIKLSHEKERMTDELGKMFIALVNRYGSSAKFKVTDTFRDDMKAYALSVLANSWYKFNSERSNNPFAYFTQIAKNAFYQYQNQEKKQRDIKNELLIKANLSPSFAYQVEYEERMKEEARSYEGRDDDD